LSRRLLWAAASGTIALGIRTWRQPVIHKRGIGVAGKSSASASAPSSRPGTKNSQDFLSDIIKPICASILGINEYEESQGIHEIHRVVQNVGVAGERLRVAEGARQRVDASPALSVKAIAGVQREQLLRSPRRSA
jgi:hypothetical protein